MADRTVIKHHIAVAGLYDINSIIFLFMFRQYYSPEFKFCSLLPLLPDEADGKPPPSRNPKQRGGSHAKQAGLVGHAGHFADLAHVQHDDWMQVDDYGQVDNFGLQVDEHHTPEPMEYDGNEADATAIESENEEESMYEGITEEDMEEDEILSGCSASTSREDVASAYNALLRRNIALIRLISWTQDDKVVLAAPDVLYDEESELKIGRAR